MLRLIQIGNGLPVSYPVNPTSTFEAGMIAQLSVIGNDIVCGVSDGTAPLGIIDDINTSAFSAPVNDEVIDIAAVGTLDGYGNYVSVVDLKEELSFPNVIANSFVSDTEGILLNSVNGVLTAPAGTVLNYDSDGDGVNDTIRVIVSYTYRIANVPGDNTTAGSSRITVWINKGIYETDQYDTTQPYAVNVVLFCGSDGKLTTKQPSANHPGIALVTGPPSGIVNTLEFMWF